MENAKFKINFTSKPSQGQITTKHDYAYFKMDFVWAGEKAEPGLN